MTRSDKKESMSANEKEQIKDKKDKSEELDLESSYQYSISIMKQHSATFSKAFALLPAERFRAVAAIYAFCRTADDLVDSSKYYKKQNTVDINPNRSSHKEQSTETETEEAARTEAEKREILDSLDALEMSLIRGEVLNKPWGTAFFDTCRRYGIPLESLCDQLEGQRRDLTFRQPKTLKNLLHYCDLVAGSVGRMLLPVLIDDEYKDKRQTELEQAVTAFGIAMQITNILRDVGEDYRERGRIYLPADRMKFHGINKRSIAYMSAGGTVLSGFKALFEELDAESKVRYDVMDKYISYFRPEAHMAIKASGKLYYQIVQHIRNCGFNCFTVRQSVSDTAKQQILRKLEDKQYE